MGRSALTMKNLIKSVFSITFLALLIISIFCPKWEIDTIEIILALLIFTPWFGYEVLLILSKLIKSIKFPGWEITFNNLEEAGQKIIKGFGFERKLMEYVNFRIAEDFMTESDPNLALVKLRNEIERRLKELAVANQIDVYEKKIFSILKILELLREKEIINHSEFSGLKELIRYGNLAAHGEKVDSSALVWTKEHGPYILAFLDKLIRKFS